MVQRSVQVTRVPAGEVCDFCGRQARFKATNRKFFVVVACRDCWVDLRGMIDEFLGEGHEGGTRPRPLRDAEGWAGRDRPQASPPAS